VGTAHHRAASAANDKVVPCLIAEFVYKLGMATGRDNDEHRAYLKAFGVNLKIERTRRGLSQREFADIIGMHRTFYGRLERGQRGFNIVELRHRPRAWDSAVRPAARGRRRGRHAGPHSPGRTAVKALTLHLEGERTTCPRENNARKPHRPVGGTG
jgi:DNA-binding XRE family transcriptional regulator